MSGIPRSSPPGGGGVRNCVGRGLPRRTAESGLSPTYGLCDLADARHVATARNQASDGDIFIQRVPMQAHRAEGDGGALGGRGVQQAGLRVMCALDNLPCINHMPLVSSLQYLYLPRRLAGIHARPQLSSLSLGLAPKRYPLLWCDQ